MDPFLYQLALVVAALFLVFLNGFFVASEFSIVKVRETRLQELAALGNRSAPLARRVVAQMDEYLSATQLGITLASLGLGWIGEPAFAELFLPLFADFGRFDSVLSHSLAATMAFLLITFLHIVLGELAPKSLAIQQAESTMLHSVKPLHWFYRLSYPFIWSLNGTANMLLRLVGMTPASDAETAHSEEELRLLLARSRDRGILEREEQLMLERVFDFTDRSVRQVMVPSVEINFLDTEKSFDENLAAARRHGHTRYPLCEGSLDQLIGIVNVKDLFWRLREVGSGFDLRQIRRPVRFVPDTKYIKGLLSEFRQTRTHIAIVVDEFGSTVGLVTLEDILEEIVGEIQDEFDRATPREMVQAKGPASYLVHGRTLIDELNDALEIDLDDSDNDTVGGHVMTLLGRTARVGDEVEIANRYRARVIGMKGLQITDLTLDAIDSEESGN